MLKPIEIKDRIVSIIKTKGPSLPIQIAKELKISSLFVSAFLSELSNEKRIKVSSLKVGGSPLYFLEGQTQELEKFYKYFHPKEAEAFLLLKENKILKDEDLEPAIRVALRQIKDFAIAFKDDENIFWRYTLIPENEVIEIFQKKQKPKEEKPEIKRVEKPEIIIEPKIIEITKEQETKITEKPKKIKSSKPRIIQTTIEKQEFENPLVEKIIEKPKKEKPKSEFVLKVIDFLYKNNFKIIEEKEHKSKEYICIAEIETNIGPISFLTLAKEKKLVSNEDLKKLLSDAQKIPLPALFIAPGELSKKAHEYQQMYYSILKIKKLS